MRVKVIAELGSCHMGKLERIKEAIDLTKSIDLYALKVQLFPNQEPFIGKTVRKEIAGFQIPTHFESNGNVYLAPEIFKLAFEYAKEIGVNLTASVFDMESYYFLRNLQPLFIKFAYSQKHQWWITDCLDHGIEAIVSCDVMTDHLVDKRATKLYCIPEYPVRYEISFDGLFPRFDGFSDHTLGVRQTQRAIDAGAQLIEKHVKLGYADETCPDAAFAIKIEDLSKLHLQKF